MEGQVEQVPRTIQINIIETIQSVFCLNVSVHLGDNLLSFRFIPLLALIYIYERKRTTIG